MSAVSQRAQELEEAEAKALQYGWEGTICCRNAREIIAAKDHLWRARVAELVAERDEWIEEARLRGLPAELMMRLNRAEAALVDLRVIAQVAHDVIIKAPPEVQKEFLEGIAQGVAGAE